MIHRGKTFTDQRILLDGSEFYDCVFTRCVLVFRGEQLPVSHNSLHYGCKIKLEGMALEIARILSSMGWTPPVSFTGWDDPFS